MVDTTCKPTLSLNVVVIVALFIVDNALLLNVVGNGLLVGMGRGACCLYLVDDMVNTFSLNVVIIVDNAHLVSIVGNGLSVGIGRDAFFVVPVVDIESIVDNVDLSVVVLLDDIDLVVIWQTPLIHGIFLFSVYTSRKCGQKVLL
jgi:uncharacterized protein YaaW (UPF0174 family)